MVMTTMKAESLTNDLAAGEEGAFQHSSLGEISYKKDDLLTFPQGLLGFEKKKRYILVEREACHPFQWMLCPDDANVGFLVVNPLIFQPDYSPNISRRELKELEIDNPQSLSMYVIITLKEDFSATTANLSGPILLNAEKKIGKQLVLLDDSYSTKHRIINTD